MGSWDGTTGWGNEKVFSFAMRVVGLCVRREENCPEEVCVPDGNVRVPRSRGIRQTHGTPVHTPNTLHNSTVPRVLIDVCCTFHDIRRTRGLARRLPPVPVCEHRRAARETHSRTRLRVACTGNCFLLEHSRATGGRPWDCQWL